MSDAATTGHEIAFGILCAALGEPRAVFAEDHYGAQLRSLADELIAWEERHANT